jgi:hypothetical protein
MTGLIDDEFHAHQEADGYIRNRRSRTPHNGNEGVCITDIGFVSDL